MKHHLLSSFATLIALISFYSCNSGHWEIESEYYNIYYAKDGSSVLICSLESAGFPGEYLFGVSTTQGKFDFEYIPFYGSLVKGSINLYKGGKQVDEFVGYLNPGEGESTAVVNEGGKIVYDHLKEEGSIRIIIPRRDMEPFDLTIPQFPDMK